MYRRDGVMVKAPRRKATGNNISICFPSKNVLSVCHLEPAAQWHTQTEEVYSFARTLFSKCHKISAHAAGQCAHGKEKLEGTLPACIIMSGIGHRCRSVRLSICLSAYLVAYE